MYGSVTAAPITTRKSSTAGKRSMLLRELSDDETEIAGPSSASLGNPWKGEFTKYYDAVDALPDGVSVVEWWGVSTFDFPMIMIG